MDENKGVCHIMGERVFYMPADEATFVLEPDLNKTYIINGEKYTLEQIVVALAHHKQWKDVKAYGIGKVEEIMRIKDPIDRLCELERIIGFGEGKGKVTHIVDTPTKIELVRARDITKAEVRDMTLS